MKKLNRKNILLLFVVVILTCALVLATACDNKNKDGKKTVDKPAPGKTTPQINVVDEFVTITIDLNGGTIQGSNEPIKIKKGTKLDVADIEIPEKDGMIFVEFLYEGEAFDFSQPIDDNITLVAEYKEKEKIKIKLNIEGDITEKEVFKGDFLELEEPKKSNYDFIEWRFGGEPFDFSQKINKSIELVAFFAPKLEYIEDQSTGTFFVKKDNDTPELEELFIPAYYKGKKVTGVLSFPDMPKLEKVILPNTITEISNVAFPNSDLLSEYEIYDAFAFNKNDAKLVSKDGVIYTKDYTTLVMYPIAKPDVVFNIPEGVTTISENAFLDKINKLNSSGYGSVGRLGKVVLPSTIECIEDSAFQDRGYLREIIFEKEVIKNYTIGVSAFENVKFINFPFNSKIEKIGDYAFAQTRKNFRDKDNNKKKLQAFEDAEIKFSETLKEIGKDAFLGTQIQAITFNKNIECIGDGAFSKTFKIKNITFPDEVKLKTWNSSIFMNSKVETLKVPNGVEHLADGAFQLMTSLTELKMPETLKTFGLNLFDRCRKLTVGGIKFDPAKNNVFAIDEFALYTKDKKQIIFYAPDDAKLEYDMPDSVEIMPKNVFEKKTINKIHLSENLIKIPEYAFASVEGLKEIKIPASVKEIDSNAFHQLDGVKLIFDENSMLEKANAYLVNGADNLEVEINSQSVMDLLFANFDEPCLSAYKKGNIKLFVKDGVELHENAKKAGYEEDTSASIPGYKKYIQK